MGIMAMITGRKAYAAHIKGNRLSDMQNYREAAEQHALAQKLYEESMAKGMGNSSYLMAYAVLLLRNRDYEKARDIMLRVEKMPLSADQKRQLRQNYAICLWKLGKLDQAIELLKGIAAQAKNSWLYGSLGYMLIEKAKQTGEYDEAIAFSKEALEYDDEDAVVLDNVGQMYLSMGDREKAYEYFIKAHEEKPHQVDTLYYLGLMAHQDGKDDEARQYLESALKGNYTALCTTSKELVEELLGEIK